MTSTIRGPLAPAIYWRRRIFVLGIVAALVLIIANLTNGGGARQPDGRAEQISGDVVTSPGPGGATTNSENKKRKKRQNAGVTSEDPTAPSVELQGPVAGPTVPVEKIPLPPVEPVLIDPVGHCADDDIAMTPVVTDAVAGRVVTVTLQLRTITAASCTWRISPNHLALKITDGTDEVWSSRECPRKLPTASVVVRNIATSTFDLTWNSRRSEAGCPRLTDFAQPGDYTVTAAAYGGEPSSSTFDLAVPPPVEPVKAPAKPSKDDKKSDKKKPTR